MTSSSSLLLVSQTQYPSDVCDGSGATDCQTVISFVIFFLFNSLSQNQRRLKNVQVLL